jgi:hypothetical protein
LPKPQPRYVPSGEFEAVVLNIKPAGRPVLNERPLHFSGTFQSKRTVLREKREPQQEPNYTSAGIAGFKYLSPNFYVQAAA